MEKFIEEQGRKLARVVQLFSFYGFLSKNGGRDEFW